MPDEHENENEHENSDSGNDFDITAALSDLRAEIESLRADNERMKSQNDQLVKSLRDMVTGNSNPTPADPEQLRSDFIKKCRL